MSGGTPFTVGIGNLYVILTGKIPYSAIWSFERIDVEKNTKCRKFGGII